ncbi:MAG: HDIG domain-containing protein [Clostridia bacterium]|nr:HDIG domain-containing protein [Clostridia bacterium]
MAGKAKRRRRFRMPRFLSNKRFHTCLISFLGFVLIFVITLSAAVPKRHSLRVGEIASQTITATKDVEDEVATLIKQQNAADQVIAIYSRDDSLTDAAVQQIDSLCDDIIVLHDDYVAQKAKPTPVPPTPVPTPTSTPVQSQDDGGSLPPLATVSVPTATPHPVPSAPAPTMYIPPASTLSILRDKHQALQDISNEEISEIITGNETDLDELRTILLSILSESMGSSEGLSEDRVETVLRDATVRIDSTVRTGSLKKLGKAVLDSVIRANVFLDEDATNLAKEEAMKNVAPVMYKKGQNIVMQGEVVTEAQYAMMKKLGIVQDARGDSSLYWGLGLLILLMWVSLELCIEMFYPDVRVSKKKTLLYVVIMLITIGIATLLKEFNAYVIPVQLAVLLIAVLLHRRLAQIINTIVVLCVCIIAFSDEGILSSSAFPLLIMTLFSSTIAIAIISRSQHRTTFVLAGLVMGGLNAVAVLAAGALINNSITAVLTNAMYAIVGGFLSGILSIGLLPVLEMVFTLLTSQKLLELSNSNQPLLRRMQTEAPGSYQHSLMVANLAEAAADAIGADTLLVRAGAYYHDIGKMNRPAFFKENQLTEDNPHDRMSPEVSAAILKAHVTEGAELAQKAKLPREIVDFIRQHHGTTQQAYFYVKAKKEAEETGKEVQISDYTYPGPKPSTREIAIVALADTVEAATRTMKTRTPESIRTFIHKLISDRIAEGQLSDAPLTLKDIQLIEDSFCKTVSSMYHERIEYPSLNQNGQLEALPEQTEKE